MTGMPEDLAVSPNFGTDVFSEVLDIVHVRGETARVITTEDPLSVTVPAGQLCVYILEMGQLEIRVGSRPAVKLRQNQIALLLQGVDHDVQFGLSGLTTPPVGPTGPRTGGDGRETIKCFWGSFTVDGDLAARLLQSLPQVIVLDDPAEAPIEWVDTVCDLVLRELGATRPGGALMVSRLLDLLLVILLRRWAQSEDRLPDWLAAAKDQRIARAVSAIHADPSRDLSNSDLADLAGMSRSSFTERFKLIMGQQPGAYVRNWRLFKAAEALRHSSTSIKAIAAGVGYASKEAFSRAFHAKFGTSPSAWRASRRR